MSRGNPAFVGVFAALAYAGSFLLLAIPNATLSILLVFFAGYLLGKINGLLVGVFSALLITLFNPYGLPLLPILAAQVGAYAVIGWSGGLSAHFLPMNSTTRYLFTLAVLGLLTALIYQVPVSVADAYLFGPFWERLLLSAGFAAITIAANILFFILLFPVLAKLKKVGIFHIQDRDT
ncbi:MAG: hypothetical protein KAT58_08115 [candidate division Zixibacteria bacterium]|nr:hypothetical protein [candidate division Zixibacteria bacterium]